MNKRKPTLSVIQDSATSMQAAESKINELTTENSRLTDTLSSLEVSAGLSAHSETVLLADLQEAHWTIVKLQSTVDSLSAELSLASHEIETLRSAVSSMLSIANSIMNG